MSTGPPGSRPHRLSTSTPPPSPPLATLAPAKTMYSPRPTTKLPSSPQENPQDHGQDHHRHSSKSPERNGRPKSTDDDPSSSVALKGFKPPSPLLGDADPTATAAAAAAAASYTMQELAIAYSMVTSTRQQQQQEQERKQQRQQGRKDVDNDNHDKEDESSRPINEEDNAAAHAAAHAAALALVRHRRHSPPPVAEQPSDPHHHRPQQPSYQQHPHDHERAPVDEDRSRMDDHHSRPRNSTDQGHGRMAKEGSLIQQQHAQIHPPSFPARDSSRSSASVSQHPNALNRYPFSIPSISAKLDQPHHADGSDALSSLWKKTTPLQEPYFQTRHTIASQHTLSTLGGVLFSLDEVPMEFNQDMYIAMRNRIFELEAKSVNYSPFSHSRKRSMDRAGIEETADRFGGYDRRYDPGHYAKRPMHGHRVDSRGPPLRSSAPSDDDRFPGPTPHHRGSSSYPSWYTPEVYTSGSRAAYAPDRYPMDREAEYPSIDPRTGHDLHPSSRPGSPHSNLPPMRSARSPPPQAGHPRSHSRQQGSATMEERFAMDERLHAGSSSADSMHSSHPLAHRPSNHGVPSARGPMHPAQHPQKQSSGVSPQTYPHPSQGHVLPHALPQPQPGPQSIVPRPLLPNGSSAAALTEQQQRQSIHQQRHRAQQQAQSAHSRSYHLHKHMRMLDQQRQAQMAAKQHFQQQQQEQQQQHQHHQKQQQLLQQKHHPLNSTHGLRQIQRHYQPHQQMYPVHQQPIPIKPHPGPQQAQALRPAPGQQPQGQLSQQQLMMQRYQQQRQLQQKQLQLRQLQYLRNKSSAQYPTQANSSPSALAAAAAAASSTPGSHSPTPPRVFGSQVDRPIKKSTRPPECANCMALDNLSLKPKADSTAKENESSAEERNTILCSACTQYLQAHGKPRPVPPFRTNFLKKIHTRFKRELQEVRFQGWQDAQVLEIEDKMDEREFQMVFNGLDEADAANVQRPATTAATTVTTATTATTATAATAAAASETSTLPAASSSSSSPKAAGSPNSDADKASSATPTASGSGKASNIPEDLVIKIEDDDDARVPPNSAPKTDDLDIRTYQSEASVGELFGHRWRTEPVVGYTLVHFGGSDRTRMVPMNPTVPSLTVTFNRTSESITFAFRVLVNGLCLLSTGGGPPALHMPETADDDDDDEEEEEEVVVIADNDKEGSSASPLPDTKTPDRSDSASAKQTQPSDSVKQTQPSDSEKQNQPSDSSSGA